MLFFVVGPSPTYFYVGFAHKSTKKAGLGPAIIYDIRIGC
jgi:hypothetical protein